MLARRGGRAARGVSETLSKGSGVARAFDEGDVDDTLHYVEGYGLVDATVFAPAPASRLRGFVVNIQKDFAFLRTEPLVCVDGRFDWKAVMHAIVQTVKNANAPATSSSIALTSTLR